MAQSVAGGDADHGFVLCYLEAQGVERRECRAGWPGLLPEGFRPVRGFRWTRGQGHMPGWWWSVTTGCHIGYESWLERDLIRTSRRVTIMTTSCGQSLLSVSAENPPLA